MVIALNMYDELGSGAKPRLRRTGTHDRRAMVPVVGRTGKGLHDLFDRVIKRIRGPRDDTVRHVHVSLGNDIELAVRQLVDAIKATPVMSKHFSALSCHKAPRRRSRDREEEISAPLESPHHEWAKPRPPHIAAFCRVDTRQCRRQRLEGTCERASRQPADSAARQAACPYRTHSRPGHIVACGCRKYGFVSGALAETYTPGTHQQGRATRFIDKLATKPRARFRYSSP